MCRWLKNPIKTHELDINDWALLLRCFDDFDICPMVANDLVEAINVRVLGPKWNSSLTQIASLFDGLIMKPVAAKPPIAHNLKERAVAGAAGI